MAVSAAAVAIPAKLIGDVVNQAYEHRNMSAILRSAAICCS
jgi:hypothetical protein